MSLIQDYKMTNEERGLAIIINNKEFDEALRLQPRVGTDADQSAIYDLFFNLGFEEIKIKNNCTVRKMKELFSERVCKTDFTEKDCLVCAILSYGGEGFVYGTDNRIELKELFKDLKKKCDTLVGKPKLFFIQTCPVDRIAHDGPNNKHKDSDPIVIPVEADTLIVQSCLSGALAWQDDKQKPSWFIETLVAAFETFQFLDLLTLTTRFTQMLAEKVWGKGNQHHDLPVITTSTLTKEVNFSC